MRSISILAAVICAGLSAPVALAHDMQVAAAATPAGSSKLEATRTALRELWHGHVVAVRKVVVAGIAKNTSAGAKAEAEVVSNAHAIAAAIEPYYGAPARDQLFALLAGHYGAVKAYSDASLAKDGKKQAEATGQITANAEAIAKFLSGANPNLPEATLFELLQAHGGHHISQIQQLIAKDRAGEAATWKDMTAHMNVIADALADGIAKQFPAKF